MTDRTAQAIADAVREVFDGHCGSGARVDPERPSWEQVGREVVAGLAAEGGVVVWPTGDEVVVLFTREEAAALSSQRSNFTPRLRQRWLAAWDALSKIEAALSPVSAETTESEQ